MNHYKNIKTMEDYLHSLDVVDTYHCLEEGFYCIEFSDGRALQCNLVKINRGRGYYKAIDVDCSGYDGDWREDNLWAIQMNEHSGVDYVLEYILDKAEEDGFVIVS